MVRPIFVAIAFFLGLAVWPHAASATAPGQAYVDRRVSALPAASLLHVAPRQLIDARRYEHAARGLDEVGRLVGGWIKAQHAQSA